MSSRGSYVHYWDPHQVYNQPEPYRSIHAGGAQPEPIKLGDREHVPAWGWVDRLDALAREKIDLYDGELTYVDQAIAQVLGVLERLGVYEDTAVIVTADHGEDLEEHHAPFEHREPYETTVGIPLILKPADGAWTGGQRICSVVGSIDLTPSILDMAGLAAPQGVEGRSWMPLVRGEDESRHECLFLTGGIIRERGTWKCPELAIRTDRHKYIRRATLHYTGDHGQVDIRGLCAPPWRGEPGHTAPDWITYFNSLPRRELYDLQADPHEQHNLVDALPAVVGECDSWLRRFAERQPERLVLD